MKTQPKTKAITTSRTPAEQSRLRRQQIETLRAIMERVVAKFTPMTAAEIRSSKRKPTRTKKAE